MVVVWSFLTSLVEIFLDDQNSIGIAAEFSYYEVAIISAEKSETQQPLQGRRKV